MNGTTSTTTDYGKLDLRVFQGLCKEVGQSASPDIKIQTSGMVPETDSKGRSYFLDARVMKENGCFCIWGDLLCHPKTLKLLKESIG